MRKKQGSQKIYKPIRSLQEMSDRQKEDYYYRMYETNQQIQKLIRTYYGEDSSYLPYMYDIRKGQARGGEPFSGNEFYIFNPTAADYFIEQVAECYEMVWEKRYMWTPSKDHLVFVKNYLYLAVRIGCKDERLSPYMDYYNCVDGIDPGPLNTGTFRSLIQLSVLSRIRYSEEEFHRRYEIGIKEVGIPGLFHPIEMICDLLGHSGYYYHPPVSAKEDEDAYEEDRKMKEQYLQEEAEEAGMSPEEFREMVERNNLEAAQEWEELEESGYTDEWEEVMQEYAQGFPDADRFLQAAVYYRDHLFEPNNLDIVNDIADAIHFFLMHNGRSVLGDSEHYLNAHAEVSVSISELNAMSIREQDQ